MPRRVVGTLLCWLVVASALAGPEAVAGPPVGSPAGISVGSWGAQPSTGPWVWPVAGSRDVSRAFAPPASRYGAGHRGADLPADPGAGVRAAGAGRVSYAGLLAGRGVVVVVHGALRTTYEPVTAAVAVGHTVAAGEVIGLLQPGHAGCAMSACLHWGLRRGEVYLDPVRLVRAGPVRLLPPRSIAARLAGGEPAGPASLVGREPADAAGRAGREPAEAGPSRTREADRQPQRAPAADLVPAATQRTVPLVPVALALLVAGVGLLARPGAAAQAGPLPSPPPRFPPRSPPPSTPPLSGPQAAPPFSDKEPPDARRMPEPTDLVVERLRRRGAS